MHCQTLSFIYRETSVFDYVSREFMFRNLVILTNKKMSRIYFILNIITIIIVFETSQTIINIENNIYSV